METAANLLPHTGYNGKPVPPKFPQLGKVFSDATADPQAVAGLAKKLEAMRPEIEQAAEPAGRRPALRGRACGSGRITRNAQGTDRAAQGPGPIGSMRAPWSAARTTSRCSSARYYLGHTHKGYEYKIITNAEGHELLATAADLLNNPKTQAGTHTGATRHTSQTFRGSRHPATAHSRMGNRPEHCRWTSARCPGLTTLPDPSPGTGIQLDPGVEVLARGNARPGLRAAARRTPAPVAARFDPHRHRLRGNHHRQNQTPRTPAIRCR